MRWFLGVGAAVMGTAVVVGPWEGEARPRWRFAVVRDGEEAGRMDVGLARRDGTVFMVSAFYPGREALQRRAKKTRPARRSYAELPEPGVLGKVKRWETLGRVEHYWMLFALDKKVRVRHEKGAGGKADVREIGQGTAVVPLDRGLPHLAWLLVSTDRSARTVACASPVPGTVGQARVAPAGAEKVRTLDGQDRAASRFDITGDCGTFAVWIDGQGEPLALESSDGRSVRIEPEP